MTTDDTRPPLCPYCGHPEMAEQLDAERARHAALVEAAQAMCDQYAHFSDCYPVGPCTCGLDALRAALASEDAG